MDALATHMTQLQLANDGFIFPEDLGQVDARDSDALRALPQSIDDLVSSYANPPEEIKSEEPKKVVSLELRALMVEREMRALNMLPWFFKKKRYTREVHENDGWCFVTYKLKNNSVVIPVGRNDKRGVKARRELINIAKKKIGMPCYFGSYHGYNSYWTRDSLVVNFTDISHGLPL